MTDAELRDAAWAELVKTTTGYARLKVKPPTDKNSAWYKAKVLLDQIGGTITPPPPLPTPGVPWAGYRYEVTGVGSSTAPSPEFQYQADGRLRLTVTKDTPRWTTAEPRQLLSAYLNNGQAGATEGAHMVYQTTIEIPADFQFTTGNVNWLHEWHTANGQLSCGIGVHTDYPASLTTPGKNPVWMLQVNGPAGMRTYYGPAVTVGATVTLDTDVIWSSGGGGRFSVKASGATIGSDQGANLFAGDSPGLGIYLYRLAVPWTSVLTFSLPTLRKIA